MSTLSNQNFGLIIAFLLPGFVALWGVSYFSPAVASWITVPQQDVPTVAGFMYVTLASLAAGVTVSAVRWAIIDHLHHATGIVPPVWKFAHLEGKLQGYVTLVENHYRYYQFYSNMFIATAFTFCARLVALAKLKKRMRCPERSVPERISRSAFAIAIVVFPEPGPPRTKRWLELSSNENRSVALSLTSSPQVNLQAVFLRRSRPLALRCSGLRAAYRQ